MADPVVNEGNVSLAVKCLELYHTLASKGNAITFNLTVGNFFTFTLDTREEDKAVRPRRKKLSSRRELRREAKQ